MLKNVDTVIFDMDGTVLNTLEDLTVSVNYVLSEFNMPCHKIEEYQMFLEKRENLRKMAENEERYSIYIV